MPLNKVLIANRGEIALRIMRTCKELGIRTVAIFSAADRLSAHVRYADEAYCVGPAPSKESYLNIDRVLEAAAASGADAVHPGYGFLSENAAFAERCALRGFVFIGPPADAIRVMGDKTRARALMLAAGVPVLPGTEGAIESMQEAKVAAERIGYPVLTKAAAGGGGKGMRLIASSDEVTRAVTLAMSEAESSFGDSSVFMEKYLVAPRHIEVQVLFDRYGGAVHLYERECSIQRRHQKIIEEAPSCAVSPALRHRMAEAALQAASACGYAGAGTVEFLLDRDERFYFMEMNTRLQVEHPVTEWITGIDLVAAQISVASGEPLPFRQKDLVRHGHAVECRVYAEDPAAGFLPDPGMLIQHVPCSGFGVRVDAAFDEPGEVSIHYDPMIAKVSTWGRTRDEAIGRMVRALMDYRITGVKTTIPYCLRVMESAAFRRGDLSTHFVSENPDLALPGATGTAFARAAAIAGVLGRETPPPSTAPPDQAWRRRRQP